MSNTDGLNTFPANPHSMTGEYGPSLTDIRNRMSFGGTIKTKWNFQFNPLLTLMSGQPFDITVGQNLYGDTLFSGRPGIATDPNKPGVIQTTYTLLDPNPTPGEQILPRNDGRGPGIIMLNLRVGKAFSFGPSREAGQLPPVEVVLHGVFPRDRFRRGEEASRAPPVVAATPSRFPCRSETS